jgi:hypothetical protein
MPDSRCSLPPGPGDPDDSCDLTDYFNNPAANVRTHLYTETFYPNFDPAAQGLKPGPSMGWQAIRNQRWKYARSTATTENWLYDLKNDQAGNNNLFPPLPGSPAADALHELELKLGDLLPGGLLSMCERTQVGQSCTVPSPPISEECCSEVCSGAAIGGPLQCRNPPWGAEPFCPDTPWLD